jgi:diadenosine tetraphosphate (Ap4A) HIT family hydrolase
MRNDCTYCRKLQALDTLPDGEVVWQFPRSVVLLGPWQFYHGYCILVARTHAEELSQLELPERRDFLDELCFLAKAIEQGFSPKKLNYELLGNQVPHLHWHVIPRHANDPDSRDPIWFAVERTVTNLAERNRLRASFLDRPSTIQVLRDMLRAIAPGRHP